MQPFENPAVEQVFKAYPAAVRRKLMALRELIFRAAASTDGVGPLEETLKWGEPAYLTSRTGSGSTIRIDWKRAAPTQYAMYFNCRTNLVDTFRTMFPGEFAFEGERAIVFEAAKPVPRDALAVCIAAALTYHRRKRATPSR